VIPADGAPGWADAGVVVPWVAYRFYGDKPLLERHWVPMRRFADYVAEHNPDGIWKSRVGNNYGDWVPAGGKTDKTALATLLHLNTCDLMARIAAVLGKRSEASRYKARHTLVREAFRAAWIRDGNIALPDRSQTLYAMGLRYGVFTEQEKKHAVSELVADLEAGNGHLSTGFLGTPVLLPALSDAGRDDLAMKLLLNRDYPSWGYMLAKGATTIWELWNSDTEGPAMNSRNHFAFGSVCEWIFEYLAGIRPLEPGFRKVEIAPRPGKPGSELESLTAHYHSVRGLISVSWHATPNGTRLNVLLPPKTPGLLRTPSGKRIPLRPGISSHLLD
jgi:alpha-L-rhamnosidase